LLIYLSILFDFNMLGLFLIPVVMLFNLEFKLSTLQKYLLILGPVLMYLKIFISATSESLNELWNSAASTSFQGEVRFGDLQLVLTKLKCNFNGDGYSYDIVFSDFIGTCPFNVGYGPFFSYIGINNDIWSLTLFLSVLFFGIFIYSFSITKIHDENLIYYSLFIISPPVIFLVMRMNLDIFIFSSIFIFIHKFGEDSFKTLFLLIFLSLLKIFPVFLMFIIIIQKIILKNYKFFYWYLITSISTLSFIFYDGIIFTDRSVRPSISNMSFGLLTYSQNIWIDVFNRYGGFRYVVIIFLVLNLGLVYVSYRINKNKKLLINLSKEEVLMGAFFLSVFLYANYDYRLTLLVFAIYPFINKSSNFIKKLIIVLFLLSPLPVFEFSILYILLIFLKTLLVYFVGGLLVANIYAHFFQDKVLKIRES